MSLLDAYDAEAHEECLAALEDVRRVVRLVRAYVQCFGFHESGLGCWAAAVPDSTEDLNEVVLRKLDRVLA